MLTKEEYKKTITRIFDSIRTDKEFLGKCRCDGVDSCAKGCPFHGREIFCLDDHSINLLFNALEYVEKWAKEHPIVTNEQKYEETFGIEPKNKGGSYFCPHIIGCECPNYRSTEICNKCKQDFWGAEYKPPIRCADI